LEKGPLPVIHTLTVRNFRALKNVHVELRPLTVLVGPNDSGKTSFLDAIHRRLRNNAFESEDRWRGEQQPEVVPAVEGGGVFHGSAEIFKLPSEGIPMVSTGIAEEPGKGAPPLAVKGENLAPLLDYLLRKDRNRFDQIQAALRNLVPGLEEIRIATPTPDKRAISLQIDGGFEISGRRLSTGVRMLFFFVALAHHPDPPGIVLIEEPENGVHPRRLKEIMDLLRSMTEGRLSAREVQVIMTTHSPYLLDHVRLPRDQVIVFRRESDGSRTATAVDESHLKAFLDEFMLGEVWFNHGEEGLLAAAQ
jgi:predicted ATPase